MSNIKEIGLKISEMNEKDANEFLLMMNNLMYFDAVPDYYKEYINKVFCFRREDDQQ